MVLLQCDGTARFVHFCSSDEGVPVQVNNDGAITYTIMLYHANPKWGSGASVRRTFPNSSVILQDCGSKMIKSLVSRQPMAWLPLRLKQLYTCALAAGITCQTCMLCDADDAECGPAKQCQFCLIVLHNSCCQKVLVANQAADCFSVKCSNAPSDCPSVHICLLCLRARVASAHS